ncbi:MAG: sulfatase [Halobacteriales archaeon]
MPPVERPNVVLIHAHDLGRHLGCYGRQVDTPHVDALAADGALFTNAFCTAPQCSPSRAALMTGRYPQATGMMGLAHMGWELDDDERTLAHHLSGAGYATRLVGHQHLTQEDPREALGYDVVATESSQAADVADMFEGAIGDLAAGDDPFLLTAGTFEPHRVYRPDHLPEEALAYYQVDAMEPLPYLPDRRGVREDLAALSALVTATLDEAIGQIDDALEAAGVADETLVVLTTDHGIAMPRAKATCYDPGLETALIARGPGVSPGERDALLSNVDVLPTVLEYCGIEVPDRIHGRSFRPLLDGAGDHVERESVHAQMTWHGRYVPMRAVRTGEYKYVRNFSLSPAVYLPGDIIGQPAGLATRGEFYERTVAAEELYHLPSDPHEQENLLSDATIKDTVETSDHEPDDPDHAAALAALREECRGWMNEVDDPLRDGPVGYPAQHWPGPFPRHR